MMNMYSHSIMETEIETISIRTERCSETGRILCIQHLRNGKLHRADGPALLRYEPAGEAAETAGFDFHVKGMILVERGFYCNGKLHNEIDPALQLWSAKTGYCTHIEYRQYGKLGRDADLPCLIKMDEDTGYVIHEEHRHSGRRMRFAFRDGVVTIKRDGKTGEVTTIEEKQGRRISRLEGPLSNEFN
ncbi:hypothetical protein [Pseudooceanicola atlanticus]|uniref:hypothetical protein n=1 Tax=Pseudooceanicola atlanticus TaxID=1461694 RepID=UPI0023523E09|nr:hypothetical protein [Pseudooceanicola atlanticus]